MSQIYFIWTNTLHVLDGLSVHHQEFKTVHTATGICQTDTAECSRQYLFDKCTISRLSASEVGMEHPGLASRVNITSMTNTYCCEYSIKTTDDGQ